MLSTNHSSVLHGSEPIRALYYEYQPITAQYYIWLQNQSELCIMTIGSANYSSVNWDYEPIKAQMALGPGGSEHARQW